MVEWEQLYRPVLRGPEAWPWQMEKAADGIVIEHADPIKQL